MEKLVLAEAKAGAQELVTNPIKRKMIRLNLKGRASSEDSIGL